MPQQSPAEVRPRDVTLLDAGRQVTGIAADLDLSANTIHIWRRQHLTGTGQIPSTSSIESAALNKAHREAARRRAENEILRRANKLMKGSKPNTTPNRMARLQKAVRAKPGDCRIRGVTGLA